MTDALLCWTASAMLAVPVYGSPAANGGTGANGVAAQEEQARTACEQGRVAQGQELLNRLFTQTNDGTYIFNQARCYQQNGRRDEALERFRAYLRRPDVVPEAGAAARRYIAELEAPPPTVIAAPRPPEVHQTSAHAEAPPDEGKTSRRIAWGLGALGVVSLAVGTSFGLSIPGIRKDRDAARNDPTVLESVNARGERAERLEWTFLGLGAAALSAGAVLYYVNGREPSEATASHFVLTPLAWRDGGEVMLGSRF